MRLFAAILVPPPARPAISSAAERLRDCMGVRLLPPEDWHLTLRFIGDADEARAKQIGDALAAVKFAGFLLQEIRKRISQGQANCIVARS